MPNHQVRDTLLVLLIALLSAAIVYGLYLYNQSLNSVGGSHSQTFWQLLQNDIKHMLSQLNQGSQR